MTNRVTTWNPHYVAYAAAQGRSPEAQMEHDRGKMHHFIGWMNHREREFRHEHPECVWSDGSIRDDAAWSAFVAKRGRELVMTTGEER